MNWTGLTRRQRRFLADFLAVSREEGQSVHYAEVARRLGLSAVTAYEMLRLLEDRGLVVSEYVLPASGPGRASVVFRPSEQAEAAVAEPAGAPWDEEWEQAQARLLAALKACRSGDYGDLIEALVQRLDQPRPALLYAADLLTAAVLTLYRAAGRAAGARLEQLRRIGLADEPGLSILNGLILGLSLVDRANRTAVRRLLRQAEPYSRALAGLSPDHRRQLLKFMREVVGILRRQSRRADQPAGRVVPA